MSARRNQAPTVTLTSPASGATFTAPATITLTATASDADGSVAAVDFYSGSTLLGSASTSPYSWSWTNVAAGGYSVSAVARDNLGASSSPSAVDITVTAPPPGGLPVPWLSSDIGAPALSGSATYSAGVFTVGAAGIDIWGTADQFRFVYQPLTGDGEIVAQVASLQPTDPWAKAGVMVRETLTAASEYAFVAVTPANGLAFQRRSATGGSSVGTSGGTGAAPYWVRLVRAGSTFSAYMSTTGSGWTLIATDTLSMAATVYVGLAVTSHNAQALTTATFANVALNAGTVNVPPSVTLTSPTAGARFSAPATIAIAASASDADGTIASVTFYAGSSVIGTDTTSAYGVTWSNVAAGTYNLTAVAVDNRGASTVSSGISITVDPTGTFPRQLVFTASSNQSTSVDSYRMDFFLSGSTSAIRTQNLGKPAPDVNGDITVDISTIVQGLPAGTYFITVTAIGSAGSAQSAPSPTFTR